LARKSCSLIEDDKNLFEETEEKPFIRSQSLRVAPPKRDFKISELKELHKLQSSVAELSLQLEKLDKRI
jgi:hypothetical protein